jgi:hypothetical protein
MILRKLAALLIVFFITTQCFEETDNISTTPSVDGESQQQDEKKEQNLDESFPTISKVPGTLASYAVRISCYLLIRVFLIIHRLAFISVQISTTFHLIY